MCGICGIVLKQAGSSYESRKGSATTAMIKALEHRGPDGQGLFERPQVALGHARLSVIDIAGSAQPMLGPDDSSALVFNGEIYNFKDLRAAQRSAGWSFATEGDSETILAGYSLEGMGIDSRLNGMYAYAIYDGRGDEPHVFLSVDPVGIKPLFVFENDDVVVFASELRAIVAGLARLSIPIEISDRGVRSYLRNRFVKAPLSLISGVRRLRPGERLRINVRSGAVDELDRRLRPQRPEREWDPDELQATLRDTLRGAVARQLVSDVPLGLFLSGGIDSSLILAVARELGAELDSFAVSFRDQDGRSESVNEAEIARAVAGECGSRFHELPVTPQELIDNLDDCLLAMDQPLTDPACLPLYMLAGFSRQSITVALSGDGGDELFGGYQRHQLAGLRSAWSRSPRLMRAVADGLAGTLPKTGRGPVSTMLKRAGSAYQLIADDNYIAPLFDLPDDNRTDHGWSDQPHDLTATSLMDADIDGQLAGQMLPKTDNMTMAYSLECRVPLLDLELVELASSVRASDKFDRSKGKKPLRKLLSEYLPPSITDRPKHGFRVPIDHWFRSDLRGYVKDRLETKGGIVRDYFSVSEISEMIDQHTSGAAENSSKIWSLLALQSWHENIGQVGTTNHAE